MIQFARTDSENPDFRLLVHQLDAYLTGVNGDQDDFFAQYNKIDKIKHVIVAYQDEKAVACGAIKEYAPDTMEVKRMFVPIELRGKGLASSVLTALETWAKELGYQKCILETSNTMMDAVALYKKNQYKIIPNFGQYEKVESSVCFEKIL